MKPKITTSVSLSDLGHKHQEINFKRVSKSKFMHFGILAVLISNSVFSNVMSNGKNELLGNQSPMSGDTTIIRKPSLESEPDTSVTTTAQYKKTIEEVIKEDNQIIDSNISTSVFPLNLKILDKKTSRVNKPLQSNCLSKKCCIKL